MQSFTSRRAFVAPGLVAAIVATLGFASPSRADEAACPFPAGDAKELAARGLLRAARTKLTSCLDACTGEERAMCSAAKDALHVPTIVVTVADATPQAAPRSDVRVVVDGEEAKPNVPIEVDPGPHLVQVQGARIGAEQHVVVAAGADKLAVTFATPKNAIEVEAAQGGASPWPFVVVGLGLTGVVIGMITAAVAQLAQVPDPDAPPTEQFPDLVPNPTLRAAGVGCVVGGIAFAFGGIVWHFLEKPAAPKPRAGFAPWVAPSTHGASFGLGFSQTF